MQFGKNDWRELFKRRRISLSPSDEQSGDFLRCGRLGDGYAQGLSPLVAGIIRLLVRPRNFFRKHPPFQPGIAPIEANGWWHCWIVGLIEEVCSVAPAISRW